MKISIITVVLNDLEGLKRTAKSVLSQEGADYEYIVLDGGSTDGSWEYIDSLEFRGIKRKAVDKGIYNAMNNAVVLASGDYCLFLNAGDTFCDKNVLAKAEAIVGTCDFYVGHTYEIGKRTIKGMAPDPLTLDYLMQTSIYHQSTFIRRELLLKHPYNEQHKVVSDWEFFFERWLSGCTYQKLDFFVSNYYLGGFSFVHQDLIGKERKEFMQKLLPARIIDGSYKGRQGQDNTQESYEQRRILQTMARPAIQRDLNLIRYGFKFLIRDIFKRR